MIVYVGCYVVFVFIDFGLIVLIVWFVLLFVSRCLVRVWFGLMRFNSVVNFCFVVLVCCIIVNLSVCLIFVWFGLMDVCVCFMVFMSFMVI